MDKQQLKRALLKANNDAILINVSHVASVLGIQPETAQANFLRSLEYIPNGRSKMYLVEDVANAIYESRKRNE